MAAFRRIPAVVIAMAFVLAPALTAQGVTTSTQDELNAARAKLSEARGAAQAAAAEYADAEAKQAETQNHINELLDAIEKQKARAAELKAIATQRALYAYTHRDAKLDVLVGTGDAVKAIRQTQMIERANETDNNAIRRLAAINADLKVQQTELEVVEKAQAQITSQLDVKSRTLQAALAEIQVATNALQAKLDQEIAAANAARAAQLAAEKALLAASKPSSGGGAGQIVNGPVVNGFMCPVSGAAYTNDFGGARNHGGIDMFVPTGTPLVATKSGSVSYVPFEGAGGNTVYLYGSDGNTYFYGHLSSFAGGARTVSQGEILGYSGMTGNAGAPHLHFEIRVGGPNGGKINPYPTLKASGC